MRKHLIAATLAAVISSPAVAEECTPLLQDLSFCPGDKWVELDRDFPDGVMAWTAGPSLTAKMMAHPISERLAGNREAVMAALKTSVRASLEDPGSVTFKEHHTFDGTQFGHGIISYVLPAGSRTVQIHHSFMLADTVIVQFITSNHETDDAGNLELHQDFVSSFKVVEGQDV